MGGAYGTYGGGGTIHNLYDMIYLLTAVGLPRGGSSIVHIYTQYIEQHSRHNQYVEQYKKYIEHKRFEKKQKF